MKEDAPFRAALAAGAVSLDLSIPVEALERMARHQALLARWAPRMNLVGDARWEKTVETHFLDSLALLRLLPAETPEWMDVGTGAGFPGVVLASARPDLRVKLLEPQEKRVSFLHQLIQGLPECALELHRGRTEDLQPGSQKALLSRAVLPPSTWITEAAALVAPGGWIVLMTARGPDDPTCAVAENTGLVEERRDDFTLPGGAPRVNVLYRRG